MPNIDINRGGGGGRSGLGGKCDYLYTISQVTTSHDGKIESKLLFLLGVGWVFRWLY